MPKNTSLVDTNLLVRFLTQDNQPMAQATGKLLTKAGKRSLTIPDVVMAETIFVLKSVYEIKKNDIVNKLLDLIEFKIFKLNKPIIKSSLEIWGQHNISYVDAYLCALQQHKKYDRIYTFDQGFKKVKGVETKTP